MIKYKILIDPRARGQIKDIYNYALIQFANEQLAYAILNSIENGIKELEYFPESHPLIDREPWESTGIRKVIVRTFIVYYCVNKDKYTVYVLMIAHSKMDQTNQLRKLGY